MTASETMDLSRSRSVSVNKHLGTLFVNVLDASELDLNGHSLSHANIKVVLSIGKKRFATKTRSDSFSPVWNEGPFIFEDVFNTDLLSIDVRHKATVGSGSSFGEASFGIFTSPVSIFEMRKIPLTTPKGPQGFINLDIKFEPQQVILTGKEIAPPPPLELTDFADGSLTPLSQSQSIPSVYSSSQILNGEVVTVPSNPLYNSIRPSTAPSNEPISYSANSNRYSLGTYPTNNLQNSKLPDHFHNAQVTLANKLNNNEENVTLTNTQQTVPLSSSTLNAETQGVILNKTVTLIQSDHLGSYATSQCIDPKDLNRNGSYVHSAVPSNSTISLEENTLSNSERSTGSNSMRNTVDDPKEKRGFLRSFREERSNRKNAQYNALFGLNNSERLVWDSSAAMQKNILHHGRLFGSSHFLCFYSNVFGMKISEKIPLADIVSVQKDNRLVVNPGITVKTKEGTEYHFASMASRRKTYHRILEVWKSVTSGEVPMERFSDDDFNPESVAEGEDSDGEEYTESKTVAQQSGDVKVEEKVEVVKEEKLDADITTDPGQSIHESSPDKLVEVFTTELPITPREYFSYFHSNSSDLPTRYHKERGDTNIVVEPWAPSPPNGTCRSLNYIAPVTASFGPKTTRMTERHRCVISEEKVTIEISSKLFDIPYGDHFKIESKHEVVSVGEKRSKLTVSTFVYFTKKTMFEGKIRSGTMSQMGESCQKWTNLALAELKRKKKAARTKKVSKSTKSTNGEKKVETVVEEEEEDSDEEIVVHKEKQVYATNANVNQFQQPPQNYESGSLLNTLISSLNPQFLIVFLLLFLVIMLMLQVSSLNGKVHSMEDKLEFLNRALLLNEMQRNAIGIHQ